jgi:hypothetical protein
MATWLPTLLGLGYPHVIYIPQNINPDSPQRRQAVELAKQ